LIMVEKGVWGYFWDSDPSALDIRLNQTYIIERLLDLGDEKAVHWLFKTYSRVEVAEVLRSSRSISPKSRLFWTLILDEGEHA